MVKLVSKLYKNLLDYDQIRFEFDRKFVKGFKKYGKILDKGPYAVRFSTDNIDEITKILQLRDIDERFEKVDVIPKSLFEGYDDLNDVDVYENTLGIYKWLFGKLRKEGKIDDLKKFFMIHGVSYKYEYGLKIIENDDWNFI